MSQHLFSCLNTCHLREIPVLTLNHRPCGTACCATYDGTLTGTKKWGDGGKCATWDWYKGPDIYEWSSAWAAASRSSHRPMTEKQEEALSGRPVDRIAAAEQAKKKQPTGLNCKLCAAGCAVVRSR